MKTIEEVQVFFESEIKPRLNELENWRIGKRKIFILFKTIITLVLLILPLYWLISIIIYAIKPEAEIIEIVGRIIGSLVGGFLLWLLYDSFWYGFKKEFQFESKNLIFKKELIGRLLNFLYEGLVYNPDLKEVSGEEFLGSGIFPHSIYYPDGYWAEDLVEGKIGETRIRFYEIDGWRTLEGYHVVENRKQLREVETIPYFGFFLVADFYKSFPGQTLVVPESGIQGSEWILQSGRELIKMDDPEFERLFTVYGNDQIVSRYVLSTSLMQRISEFKKKLGKKISLSFKNNRMYIAIPHQKDRFELNVFTSCYDFGRVREFYNDLRIAIEIVEDLNLNTKIYTRPSDSVTPIIENRVSFKPKRKMIYNILSLTLGFLGLQYFYTGYYLKGLKFLIISSILFIPPIYCMVAASEEPCDVILVFFTIVWFIIGNLVSSRIRHDSRGIPMV